MSQPSNSDGTESRGGPSMSQLLTGISPTRCVQLRAILISGATKAEAGDVLDANGSTIGRHALGKCNCGHEGHVLEHNGEQYVPTDEGGLTTHLNGKTPIDSDSCAMMRRAMRCEGVSARRLATVFGISKDAALRHARGECGHDSITPPVSFNHDTDEWERVEADR